MQKYGATFYCDSMRRFVKTFTYDVFRNANMDKDSQPNKPDNRKSIEKGPI